MQQNESVVHVAQKNQAQGECMLKEWREQNVGAYTDALLFLILLFLMLMRGSRPGSSTRLDAQAPRGFRLIDLRLLSSSSLCRSPLRLLAAATSCIRNISPSSSPPNDTAREKRISSEDVEAGDNEEDGMRR